MNDFAALFASPVAATILTITLITSIRAFKDAQLKFNFMFIPYKVVNYKEYHRFFTSGLIHSGIYHLVFNMLAFYYFAFALEGIIGHWQFALLYISSLVISGIPDIVRHKDNETYMALGASGAISAVLFSVILFDPEIPISLLLLPSMPGWFLGIIFIVFSFVASYFSWGNIGHDAHLWGAFAGIVITVLLEPSVVKTFNQWLETAF